jgi:hypothetical protein
MGSEGAAEVRPRSTGEILDDAWELALADAPRLLLLSGLFQVPAFCVVLLLLARPAPEGIGQVVLPALAALLLPLTGLGSGACQELLRRRAEGKQAHASACLLDALRRGPEHVAARAVVLAGALLGTGCLLLPGLALWSGCATVHAALAAGQAGLWCGLGGVTRAAAQDGGKSAMATLSRVCLLGIAAGNLYLLVAAGLWAASNLAGLDATLWSWQASLTNPVYVAVLLLFCWLLLTPFNEATNFLLYVDGRARREGLDLLFRVRRAFGTPGLPPAGRGAARAGALVLLGLLLGAGPAGAEDGGGRGRLSREQIKGFLRGQAPRQADEDRRPDAQARKKHAQERREVEREDEAPRRTGGRPAALGPHVGGDFGTAGWTLLGGVALAVLVAACVLFWSSRKGRPRAARRTGKTAAAPAVEAPALPHEQPAAVWWRQADELAGADRFHEAVRAVYLAVLSLLHRRGLLRCEPTRTNGEYVRQVRLAPQAPPELNVTFERVTERFEGLWYGGEACGAAEYEACRRLAEAVREQAG